MKTRQELINDTLEVIRESGDVVSAEDSSGIGFTDYLFYFNLLEQEDKKWEVYNLIFDSKDVIEIKIRQDGIFILVK